MTNSQIMRLFYFFVDLFNNKLKLLTYLAKDMIRKTFVTTNRTN